VLHRAELQRLQRAHASARQPARALAVSMQHPSGTSHATHAPIRVRSQPLPASVPRAFILVAAELRCDPRGYSPRECSVRPCVFC
jgi:hypothetical protein